jgi:hypothetical protein
MAWTETTEGGYTVLTSEALTLGDNANTANQYIAVTPVIPTGSYPNWENRKMPCKVQVTVAGGGAGIIDVKLQTSQSSSVTGDVLAGGSAVTPLWADASTTDMPATCLVNAETSNSGQVDATDVYAPYARLALWLTADTDIVNSTGRAVVSISFPKKDGLVGTELGGGAGVDGIGPDPS